MRTVVVSQPMFWPWVGLFEQIRLADVYVHYDDVQLPQGRSFMSRVQIKTTQGQQWLTVPVRRGSKLICDTLLDAEQDWRSVHQRTLHHAYAKAPFLRDMLDIVRSVYEKHTSTLAELNMRAIETVCEYFQLKPTFLCSSKLAIGDKSSERLVQIVNRLEGDVYITGHGARSYLDHQLFERQGIEVKYMHYQKIPYTQLHGEFTPFVSILDLVANVGPDGRKIISSGTIGWKEFVQ